MDIIVYKCDICDMKPNAELLKIIAANIVRERNRLNLTQEKLSEKANCHRNYIARCEAAKIDLSVSGLVQIAKALKLSPVDLLTKH